MKPHRVLVTGGAGFIGSHVVDRLLADGVEVVVYDNFSGGSTAHLAGHLQAPHPRLNIVREDVRNLAALQNAMRGIDTVFHFQANADVRGGREHTRLDLEQNTIATWNVLESMKDNGAQTLVFASSATVYGEPTIFPTPEDHPLVQTSLYGASKLAGEAMIQAYAEYFGLRTLVFRFVSCLGPRYGHGVVIDFLRKLRADPRRLSILGDGFQKKSYLDVRDAVAGIFHALSADTAAKAVYNLGHDQWLTVREVARILLDELGLENVRLETESAPRGWLGDSPFVHLDLARIQALGWKARITIETSIRETVRDIQRRNHA